MMSNVSSNGPAFLLRISFVNCHNSRILSSPVRHTPQHDRLYTFSSDIGNGLHGSSNSHTWLAQNWDTGPASIPPGENGKAKLLIRASCSGIGLCEPVGENMGMISAANNRV